MFLTPNLLSLNKFFFFIYPGESDKIESLFDSVQLRCYTLWVKKLNMLPTVVKASQ